jgi:AbrB family looped-hinge helix DNA binding protein
MTQINSQGQITIPPDLQQLLGLFPGTEVKIQVVGDALQLRKSTKLSNI